MTWKDYFKENSDKMPKEFADKEITVEDCLKIIDGMSFTIKELFDKTKWHTEAPTEEGWYFIQSKYGTFDVLEWYDGRWCEENPNAKDGRYRVVNGYVVAWQKKEPYKGA